ncbi:DUF4157 domain-containing protein [Sphingomonas sp. RT2P30]|uniref:eCIS core domain-containing protein n=1 Tax=Parasphingomonas halimpatiens TaxID=3096162 RepID=UPI002FCA085C
MTSAVSSNMGHAFSHAPAVQRLEDVALLLNARPALVAQRALAARIARPPAVIRANGTGLPDQLKLNLEAMSGMTMDDVRVHRNSAAPAQLSAHAYAQGSDIHIGPGQERHLPHEAWHVVQQKRGQVKATRQLKQGVAINDDVGLEAEADIMGARASRHDALPKGAMGSADVAAPTSGVAQRAKVQVSVTGVTHLVAARGGSIMEGEEGQEVVENQALEIDTARKLRSRRGPNQEVHAEFDRSAGHLFRWFRVLAVDGEAVGEDIFIRDETFVTDAPESLGTRPARIGGHGRDRMHSGMENLHQLASEILIESRALEAGDAVAHYLGIKEAAGDADPRRSLRIMQVAYAFSQNPKVLRLAESDAGALGTLATYLQSIVGRQILQEVGPNPLADVEQRAIAWDALQAGIAHLSQDEQAMTAYLDRTLGHNKGYAQIAEGAQSYLEAAQVRPEGTSFGQIWAYVLEQESNTSIWGGQVAASTFRDQLINPSILAKAMAKPVKADPWALLVSQIYLAAQKIGRAKETIAELAINPALLFDPVRALVPAEVELENDQLVDVLEYM